MKIKTALFVFCIGISQVLPASKAWAGKELGNGGDPLALDFQRVALEVIHKVQSHSEEFPELRKMNLISFIAGIKILVTNSALWVDLGGVHQECVATNERSPLRITVNRGRWLGLKDPDMKEALVLHEIAGAAGLERTGDYHISERYLRICANEAFPSYRSLYSCNSVATLMDGKKKQVSSYQAFQVGDLNFENLGNVIVTHKINDEEFRWGVHVGSGFISDKDEFSSAEVTFFKKIGNDWQGQGQSSFLGINNVLPPTFNMEFQTVLADGKKILFSMKCHKHEGPSSVE